VRSRATREFFAQERPEYVFLAGARGKDMSPEDEQGSATLT
jgi:hypothetical protein